MSLSQYEEVYGTGRMMPLARPAAYGLTEAEACAQARAWMCGQAEFWCTATCEQIKRNVCCESPIFVGEDPVRLALCGTSAFPAPLCGGGGNGGGGGADNTMIILAAIVGVGAVAALVATQAKKKVVIARVER